MINLETVNSSHGKWNKISWLRIIVIGANDFLSTVLFEMQWLYLRIARENRIICNNIKSFEGHSLLQLINKKKDK